jgi:superfamily II DNA or RNA helicase
MPTGAGKTITAQAIAEGYDALWLVHTTALQQQAPGRAVTVQSLLRGDRPPCQLLVCDEAHHLGGSAEQWAAVARDYPLRLGLTATPCRHDGAPLDLFDRLVVGASYSDLVAAGHLVPCRVYRPVDPPTGEAGLADHPARAWERYAGSRPGFAFFGRVEQAQKFAQTVQGAVVHGEMPEEERAEVMDRFRRGELRVVASVACLTEGVDVPRAEVCLLARSVSHCGAYLQAVGRVLRPWPGKAEALLIDLPGASWVYGLPTDDRAYSLSGEPVRRADGRPTLSQCPACGYVWPSGSPTCPACGHVQPPRPARVRVWGSEMVDASTPLTAEQRSKIRWRDKMLHDEAARLAWFRSRGWPPRRVAGAHQGIFGRPMPSSWWRLLAKK